MLLIYSFGFVSAYGKAAVVVLHRVMAKALGRFSVYFSRRNPLCPRQLSYSSQSSFSPFSHLPDVLRLRYPNISLFYAARRPLSIAPPLLHLLSNFHRGFSSSSNTNNPSSFDWSEDDEDDGLGKTKTKELADRSKNLPPPYDPFSKKPVVEEPDDPSNLQEIFHKMRTEGLTNNAVKMFDALSKDGLTHEALELFSVIKDKGAMPDVVAHTAVIEAYANAGGHSKEAIRTFDRMLASGVLPNSYTYAVLIKGLAKDSKLLEARKFLMQIMEKGMQPNPSTYLAVFEAYLRMQQLDDARILLEEMKVNGFRPDEKAVREHLSKRGHVFRGIMSLLFSK
ncbi:Pentatricopeptide repeat-containing protein [Apostasia shenzhenica]|uniref:Pentatricopeptide repeat-containing protein n=1 Tax=Apostasia shenzhenica TaxID=1088818 RepID=A0A2I0AGF0_9ASPA|nr:Pentatricopeptide repeat-containing protein [Apostasia shenzhenica]